MQSLYRGKIPHPDYTQEAPTQQAVWDGLEMNA